MRAARGGRGGVGLRLWGLRPPRGPAIRTCVAAVHRHRIGRRGRCRGPLCRATAFDIVVAHGGRRHRGCRWQRWWWRRAAGACAHVAAEAGGAAKRVDRARCVVRARKARPPRKPMAGAGAPQRSGRRVQRARWSVRGFGALGGGRPLGASGAAVGRVAPSTARRSSREAARWPPRAHMADLFFLVSAAPDDNISRGGGRSRASGLRRGARTTPKAAAAPVRRLRRASTESGRAAGLSHAAMGGGAIRSEGGRERDVVGTLARSSTRPGRSSGATARRRLGDRGHGLRLLNRGTEPAGPNRGDAIRALPWRWGAHSLQQAAPRGTCTVAAVVVYSKDGMRNGAGYYNIMKTQKRL